MFANTLGRVCKLDLTRCLILSKIIFLLCFYLDTRLGSLFVSDIIIILDFLGVISKSVKVKEIALLQGKKFVEEAEK